MNSNTFLREMSDCSSCPKCCTSQVSGPEVKPTPRHLCSNQSILPLDYWYGPNSSRGTGLMSAIISFCSTLGMALKVSISGERYCSQISGLGIREGFKKKIGNFPKGRGDFQFGLRFPTFLFIFKHGLNQPEMQRNFFQPLITGPPFHF